MTKINFSNTRKVSSLIIILAILANVSLVVALNSGESSKIMPLGDSITEGGDIGYRQKLYLDLTNAGFNVDFVGTLSDGGSADPPFDTDHEGHGGWHANQIRDNVYDWLVGNPADIVLLHIGTNDISWGDEDVTEVEGILNNIDQYETDYSKDVTVILARIILRTDDVAKNETTKAFNNEVEDMAQARITNGDDIIIVDMENALTYPDDMADNVHPNAVGYEKMADVWYDTVSERIAQPPVADFTALPASGPAPLTVTFSDTSTSHNGIASWAWDFGDGQTSNETNPTHTYNEGIYNVSLTVMDTDGNNDTETKINYINVTPPPNQPPIANANGPYMETEGVAITFDGSGSDDPDGDIISYLWDFGDGTTKIFVDSNLTAFATHTYTQNDAYPVTLTVTDNDSATNTTTTTATVSDTVPTANFTYEPSSPEEGDLIAFDASNSTGYDKPLSYSWDFGDDSFGEGVSPAHAYAQDGDYLVTLNVTDADESTDSTSQTITVTDTALVADFSATPTSGSEPLTVSFTDQSVSYDGIESWTWNFGDGETSSEQNPVHRYASTGLYTVSLTVSDEDGDNDTKTKFAYIIVDDSMPNANFTYSSSNPLEGDQVTFDASGSTGYDEPLSYSWDFGDDSFGEGVSPAHAYAQDGDYLVTLNVTDADESTDSTSQTITVTDTAPIADFSATPTSGLEPLTVSFTDLSISNDGIVACRWDFDNDDIVDSTEQNPTYVYGQDGVYSVTLKVYEADGGNDSVIKIGYVTVADSEPIADFSATPTGGPEPLAVSLTDLSTSYDGIESWTWNFGDGETSTEQHPTHKFPDSGTFNVSLTVTDADGSTDTITTQVLTYLPNNPSDNEFSPISPYILLFAFFASCGIFLLVRARRFRSKPAEKSK